MNYFMWKMVKDCDIQDEPQILQEIIIAFFYVTQV